MIPNQRLVNANDLTQGKFPEVECDYQKGWNDALDAAVTQAPAVEGTWLEIRYDPMWRCMKATCSRCGVRGEVRFKGNSCGFVVPDSPHCPHCGAAMKGVTP